MNLVKVSQKHFSDYLHFVSSEILDEINFYLSLLKGKRVAMINTTSFGGGVAEILHTMVPLLNDIGIETEWYTITASDDFFNFTKKMHNALQGKESDLTSDEIDLYLGVNKSNVEEWKNDFDFVVVHDPQVAPFLSFVKQNNKTKWFWRCHIDTSLPDEKFWNLLENYVLQYDAAIFTMGKYVKNKSKFKKIVIIYPSIDPLSTKNIELKEDKVFQILERYDIDSKRRIMTQVSRFDPWKDPLGVIDVYKELKKSYQDLQLILAGSMATDDPEGWIFYDRTIRHAGEDFDIHILSNFNGVGNIEINAFQTASDFVLQKSTREGFGLTVAEALWKKKPVIGGNVGGIPLQIQHSKNGFLVDDIYETIEYAKLLLDKPEMAKKMGSYGKEFVKKHFLITRHIRDYLKLFAEHM